MKIVYVLEVDWSIGNGFELEGVFSSEEKLMEKLNKIKEDVSSHYVSVLEIDK